MYFEYVKADVDLTLGRKGAKAGKGFSAVIVGQVWAIEQLSKIATVHQQFQIQKAANDTEHQALLPCTSQSNIKKN